MWAGISVVCAYWHCLTTQARRAFIPALAVMVPCPHIFAQDRTCAFEAELRQAAKGDFATVRGGETTPKSVYKLDIRTFETAFRLPESSTCLIKIYDTGSSELQCEWFVSKGISNLAVARSAYLNMVRGFINCVPPDSEIDESGDKDKSHARTNIYFSPSSWPKDSIASIEISYSFFAPWWQVYFVYGRSKRE